MKLTNRAAEAAPIPAPGKRSIVWDEDVGGFGLKIYPTGKRSFVLDYRIDDRHRRITIGQFPHITVEQARQAARQMIGMIAAGQDPAAKKPEPEVRTMTALCEDYMQQWSRPRKKTWYDDERRIRVRILPALGGYPVEAVKRIDIIKLHQQITRDAPIEANRVLTLLGKIFRLARQWGYLSESAPNPAQEVPRNPESRRDRWVTAEELPRLVAAIEAEPDIRVRCGLMLYLLTGLRNRELISRRWDDLDFDRGVLRLEDTKSGRPFYLPLSAVALEYFRAIPRDLGSPWIFPGKAGHWKIFPRRAWYRVRERAGMPDLDIHSLRHTVASWMAGAGESMRIIGGALNQSTASITERYAHLADAPLRNAFDEHAGRLLRIVRPEKKEEAG